ncbi:hypothetical protein Ancab_037348 [Ancistrocladus abbreviatus]
MPASSPSDTRNKWRKRITREPKITKRHRQEEEEDDDDDDDENDAVEPEEDEDLHPNPNTQSTSQNPTSGVSTIAPARESEVLSDAGVRISDFPAVVKHAVNRPHSSVLAISALERAAMNGERDKQQQQNGGGVVLENLSYGQLQALSAVPADSPALVVQGDQDIAASFVVTPPPIMEGRGVMKRFWNGRVHIVPMHSDWFSPTTVHRLERQVVPHYFSGKSADHTPEKYVDCRNLIVAKYMENPEKRLSINDCQGLAVGVDNEDLNRIFRFLDHWGIINYCATASNQESWNVESYLREDLNGEVHVPSASLKSIDSLIKFDKPRCRLKPSDIYSSLSSNAGNLSDLDSRIRERLSENYCCHCSRPLLIVYYQSLKDAETLLCSDCYHEGSFVIGHSNIDFLRVDSTKDYGDLDGESWTDQETLLLLEALEIYNDNWNDIAEHVGTKSKAQCILHFLRLPMEDGILENVEVPSLLNSSNLSSKDDFGRSFLKSNGEAAGSSVQDSNTASRIPFADSGNPVMSLVAFLASAAGPRVAAACAHASLAALSEDDGVASSANIAQMDELRRDNRMNSGDNLQGEVRNPNHQREENWSGQGSQGPQSGEGSSLSAEKVNSAAKAGLAAAAMKAKLFADHEEREIQRLSANIINHQLKRLELKLKQFAEVETLLMKECEQVEKTRQRFAAERARVLAARFGNAGVAPSVNMSSAMVNNNMSNARQQVMPASPSQPSISAYGSPPINHPNMSFMPRQPMFSFGPRLPLSAIQPSSSAPSPNPMFSAQASGQSSLNHPMLRPVQGTSSGLG